MMLSWQKKKKKKGGVTCDSSTKFIINILICQVSVFMSREKKKIKQEPCLII